MSRDPTEQSLRDWADRPRRRGVGWYILGMILIALAMPVIAFVFGGSDDAMPFNPGLIAFLPALGASPFGRAFFGGAPARSIDERERETLDRAVRRAYRWIMMLLLAAIVAVLAIGLAGGTAHASWQGWAQLAQALLVLFGALPVAIAEITTPLPPNDPTEDQR